jgi:uncharacterized protein YjiS (DUF1127 family)
MSNRAHAKFQPDEQSGPGKWTRFLRALRIALRVRRERRLLLGMDERMLKDLGLSGIAHAEATRPFWDVPVDRLRCRADLAGNASRRADLRKPEQQRMRAA